MIVRVKMEIEAENLGTYLLTTSVVDARSFAEAGRIAKAKLRELGGAPVTPRQLRDARVVGVKGWFRGRLPEVCRGE